MKSPRESRGVLWMRIGGISLLVNVILVACLTVVSIHEGYLGKIKRRVCSPPVPQTAANVEITTELPHLLHQLEHDNSVLICAFGDSVTQGATKDGENDFDNVYHHRLKRLLETDRPGMIVNIINAGVGGDKTVDGLGRIETDVLKYDPDLVLLEFGLNDCASDGLWGIPTFRANTEKMIDLIKANTVADIILMTPNFMATVDNPNVSEAHRQLHYPERLSGLQNSQVLAHYAVAIREIGHARKVPVADVYAAWEMLSKRMDTNTLLSNGLNHPDSNGHRLAAGLIYQIIHRDFELDLDHLIAQEDVVR